jgi:hypothetical protein
MPDCKYERPLDDVYSTNGMLYDGDGAAAGANHRAEALPLYHLLHVAFRNTGLAKRFRFPSPSPKTRAV